MVVARPLLTRDRERRAERRGRPPAYWTRSQLDLFDSPYRLTVAWGANGTGKSMAIAELVRRALAGRLHWQTPGRPYTVILAGNTWTQLGSTLRYLMDGVDKSWFRKGVRYESGGMKGQRLAVFDIVDGPGKGGELRCGTFDASNLAGPRADVVITDEPLPEGVHNELWPRLLGRNGRMYQTFTPTLGTSQKLDYLWALVDDAKIEWAGEIQTQLTIDAVTPVGGLCPTPWMTQREINEFAQGISAVEADMRSGKTRSPRLDTAYFSAFGPHLVAECKPPNGARVGIGIDYGTKPGTQRIVLVAHGGRGLYSHIWALDEFAGESVTDLEQDAESILAMLTRNGLTVADVDQWMGDRAHHGDGKGGIKSNDRLKQAIARSLGLDFLRRGWADKLPKPLQYMRTPRKYNRSVYDAAEIIHRLMVGEAPRITIDPKCRRMIEDLSNWQGSKSATDPHKHGFDSLQYIVVPMVEGERH